MIRIVAYNVSGGHERVAIGQVLAAVEPDVVLLAETPPRFHLRRLARRAGLRVAVRAGGRRLGVAVLSGERVRVINSTEHELTPHEGSPERRIAQAIIGVGSVRLAVSAVQLGLNPDTRTAHREELERALAKLDVPVVVGADLNEPPGGPNVTRLAEVLQDAFGVSGHGSGHTFPNPDPITRKSYVFADPVLAVLRAWVPDAPPVGTASHHRPVVVELAEPGEQPVDVPDAEDSDEEESVA